MNNQILLTSEIGCSSFELRKLSKGYCWSIKIYNTNIEKAYDQAKTIDTNARKDYGIEDTQEANDGT